MIKEVAKILEDYQLYLWDIETRSPSQSRGVNQGEAIKQICQLFEPKPDEKLEEFFGLHHAELDAIMMNVLREVASIKDAECQEREKAETERILRILKYSCKLPDGNYHISERTWQELSKGRS